MFRHGMRRFTTTACKGADLATRTDRSNHYGVQVAKAQGHVNGFVGGRELSTFEP